MDRMVTRLLRSDKFIVFIEAKRGDSVDRGELMKCQSANERRLM